MSRASLILISPQNQISQGTLECLQKHFVVHCVPAHGLEEIEFVDESIVIVFPGVSVDSVESALLSCQPLMKIWLSSTTMPYVGRSGWMRWQFETPLEKWISHLKSQFQKRIRQKDLALQSRLRKILAAEGESSCIYDTLRFWQSWTRAENVIWVPSLELLKVEDQRKTSLDPEVKSLESRTELELKSLFSELASGFGSKPRSLHFQCILDSPIGWVQTRVHGGLLILERPRRWNQRRVAQLARGFREIFELVHCFRVMRRQTVTDDLTGLYNHRHLFPSLDSEIERTASLGSQFSILFIDVDRFKQVNDRHGHLVGSELLSQLGALMRRRTRSTDLSFRYGGDEYLIILRGAKGKDAEMVGERLRRSVSENEFRVGENVFKLTLSIGVATYPDNAATSEEIIRIADEAMYSGKRKSRNVVQRAA